ncbi:hypothetical protein LINGRAHAP2_LOCUS28488 [Linum grandiflorum]
MKNLYNKGKVHPSPSQPPPSSPPPSATTAFLSLLPAAILSLTAALSPQDKEVLAYLISSCHVVNSSSAVGQRRNKAAAVAKDHGAAFECSCFRCYTAFWARWDASPNRHVIHDIIEAYEESLTATTRSQKKNKKRSSRRKEGESAVESPAPVTDEGSCGGDGVVEEGDMEKSAVRKIVSFVGDRIIGIFGV